MTTVKSLYWRNRSEEYDGLETYKACNALGWYAVYLDEEYVAVHAKKEYDLFTHEAIHISKSPTLQHAKRSAQEYHGHLVMSLLSN